MNKPKEVGRRDYFAGMALQGLVARSDESDYGVGLAKDAFWLADAMADAAIYSFIDNIKSGNLQRVKAILEDDPTLASIIFDFGQEDHFEWQSNNGKNALVITVAKHREDRADMIRLLLSFGANPNTKTKEGSAKALAEEIRDREALKLFEEYKVKKDV